MNIAENRGKLTIFLEGRIDTNNAAKTEKEIFNAVGDKTKDIVIDAEKLEYISSAGLRADTEKLGLIGNVCGAFSLFHLAATLGMGT